jgi:predicted nucleotidyltransferase
LIQDIVDKEEYLDNIVYDPYFDPLLEDVVRISVDNEVENLDGALFRINVNHKNDQISWEQFLAFFCRRGQLRDGENMVFNYDDPRGCAPINDS